jgi:hypothetical protein
MVSPKLSERDYCEYNGKKDEGWGVIRFRKTLYGETLQQWGE